MAKLINLTKNKLRLPFIGKLKNRRHESGETVDKPADAFVIFDKDFNIATINPLVQRLFNLILGKDIVRENISNVVPDITPNNRNNGKQQKYIDEIRKGELLFSDRVVIHSSFLDICFDAKAYKVANKIGIIFSDTAALEKTDAQTREPEDGLPTYPDNSPDCIYIHDLNGTFLHGSNAVEKLTGYKLEEIIGKSFLELPLLTPESLQKAAQLLQQSAAGKPTGPDELELIRKDGSRAFVEVSACPVERAGEIEVIGIAHDITQRKKLQEELKENEQKFKTLVATSQDGIYQVDASGKFEFINESFARTFGYTQEELLGEHFSCLLSTETTPKVAEMVEAVLAGRNVKGEAPVMHKDGHGVLVNFSATPLLVNDKIIGLTGILRDVTQYKRMVKELKSSEEYFQSLVENALDAIVVLNEDGTIRYASPSFELISGYGLEEEIARHPFELIHPEDLQWATEKLEQLKEMPCSTIRGEARFKHKDGSWHTIEVIGTNLLDNPAIGGIVANFRDITEHKQAEEALKESEVRFRNVLENSPDLIYRLNLQIGKYDYVSPSSKALLGYSPEEYKAFSLKEALSLVHPEDKDALLENCLNIVAHPEEEWKYSRIIYRAMHRDFGYRWFSDSRSVVYDDRNTPVAVIGNLRDITGYKQLEEALRQSEELFRTIFERSALGIGLVDVKGQPISINPALEQILGYTIEELRSMAWSDYMATDNATAEIWLFKEMIAGKRDNYEIEKRYIRKDGQMIWGKLTLSAVRNLEGDFQFAIAMLEDITTSKKAEESLRESEQKFRAIFDNANEGFMSVDPENRKFFNPNRKMIEMLEYASEEEMAELTVSDIHPKQELTYILGEFEKHVQRKISRSENIPVQRKDGSVFYASISSYPVTIANKPYLSCIFRDITEHKLAEDALRESEEKYKALVDTAGRAGEGIMIAERTDTGDAIISFANEQFANLLGYRVEDMIGMLARNLFLPGDRIWLHNKHKQRRKGEALPNHYGVMAIRKDGSMVPIEVSMGALQYQGKSATVVYIRDVTERKKAEEALRETRDYLESLLDHANAPIIVWDPSFKITRFNRAFEHLTGYTADEVVGRELPMLFPKSNRHQSLNEIARTLTGEHWESVEMPVLRKDGGIRLVLWNSANIYAGDGVTLLATIAQGTDITERKRAEDALHKSEARFRSLVENAMDGIAIVSKDGTITYTRPAPEPLIGRTQKELTGTNGIDLVHPDDMPEIIKVLNKLMEKTGAIVRTKVRVRHKNGSWRILEAIARNLFDDPAVEGIVVNYRDITEREQAHEQLLKHTKRIEALHAIAQSASQTLELEELLDTALGKIIGVMNADFGGVYLMDIAEKELVLKTCSGLSEESANRVAVMKLNEDTAQKLLQWKDVNMPLNEIFDESALKVIKKMSKKEKILSYAVVPFMVKSQLCGLLAVGSHIHREFGSDDLELLSAVGSQIGISVQNAMLFEEVRALVRATLDAQEAERERVCLEVHDGVAQTLVSAFQYLQTLEASSSDTAETRQLVAKTATQIKRAIQESRAIINSLQPVTLNELGLVATLRQELKSLKKETGLKIEFKADDLRLPREVETGLYRIIHEAVANARKHSNTKQLRVRIQSENGWLNVEVKDWGKGFDQSYLDMCRRRGTGLFSIRKRAELLRGICDIQSKPGQGTTVSVEIPLAGIKI